MKRSLLVWILCVVVADIAVTLFVVLRYMASRGTDVAPASIARAATQLPNLAALRKLTEDIHPRIGEIMRSSWSGEPTALPGVLAQALAETERAAREQGLTLDRHVLKKLVEASVAKHGIARGAVLREALKQVA